MKHTQAAFSRRGFLKGAAAASAVLAQRAQAAPKAADTAQPSPYTLHFAQPASKWPDALPVGNGRLGAVVFGNPALERIQLNEESIWDGEPNRDRVNPKAAAAFPRLRELLFAGKITEAEALATSDFLATPRRMPCYQTLGDLHLDFSGNSAQVEDYRLQLDLDTAIATTTFTRGSVRYTREVFSSAPEQVIAVRITSSQPGKISFTATFDRPHAFTTEHAGDNRLAMRGQALPVNDNPGLSVKEHQTGVRFYAELQAVAQGGRVSTADVNGSPALRIENADSVTLLMDCATSYRYPAHAGKTAGVDADVLTGDPAAMSAAVRRNLSRAAALTYDDLRARHIADHQRFFRRVDFSLGPDPNAATPTDQRVRTIKAGGDDPHLVPIYFQYGRYMLISSSRPGTLAANLQGIWNESVDPPWGSKYTVNINAEMNYWFAEAANLSDCHLPLFDLLDATVPQATRTAHSMYGLPGTVVHHNTDVWGDAVPIDGLGGGVWPMGAAWLSLHLWTHYEYTGDRRFLRERAYPTLRSQTTFLLAYLTRDPRTGHLTTGPSCSPENAYIGPDGKPHNLCMGPTMDIAITRSVFARFLQAAAALGHDVQQDAALHTKVRAAWAELPPYALTADGRLREWPEDYKEREPGHRHISHLFGLFPEDQISLDTTPELAHAARATLDKRLAAGGGSTGWSRSWIINCMARLHDGEACHANILELFRQSTRPNLFDVCGLKENSPFQIDGNLGAPNGLIEMLLQSQGSTPLQPSGLTPEDTVTVRLFPALPKAWPEGSIHGLRTRGGLTVDLNWANGRPTAAILHAERAVDTHLQLPAGINLASHTPNLRLKTGEHLQLTFA